MSVKTQLQHSIKQMLKKDQTGSYATRYDRVGLLMRTGSDIVKLGYKINTAFGLKAKHIAAIVKYWQESNLSNATIKNRLSALRHLSQLMHKSHLVASNTDLNVGKRKYFSAENKALNKPDFIHVTNKYIKASLELQQAFGLRREESLKIKPHLSDKGDKLELHASWCKGGRGRIIPIRTKRQRECLERAKEIAEKPGNSLIPKGKTYISQRHLYDKQVQHAGLKNLHGLRHAYAQKRYKELTGWNAPICGGKTSSQYTIKQKEKDYFARMILTEELGHSREQITVNYIGR